MKNIPVDFSHLKEIWPSTIVARTQIHEFTGGILSEKYLANLDSSGDGPRGRVKIGKRIGYEINQLIQWLENRSQQLS